jgi:hypothetical protein
MVYSLDVLVQALTWPDNVRQLVRPLRESIIGLVIARMETVSSRDGSNTLTAMPRRLSQPSLGRLMLAPELMRRLFLSSAPSQGTLELVNTSLEIEIERERNFKPYAAAIDPSQKRCWNAMGDCWMDASGIVRGYPTLGEHIAFDFGSPYLPMYDLSFDRRAVPIRLMADNEVDRALRDIRAAYQLLAVECPVVVAFIESFTAVISFRVDEARSAPDCGSLSECPGRTIITTAPGGHMELAWILEALVHESIHDALLYLSLLQPIGDTEKLGGMTVSPWTGRKLSLAAFVHACFVWYGLWNFWQQFASAKASMQAWSKRRQNVAASGFRRDGFLAAVSDLYGVVRPDILRTIVELDILDQPGR